MKSGLKAILIIVAVIALLAVSVVGTYNRLATGREAIVTAKAQIATNLQRRADLIPNLVASVQSFAAHETDVINAVVEARKAISNASSIEELAAADQQMTNALSGLSVIVENYPELKSDTVYIGLMDELAGSENRIAVSRGDYNGAVQSYNTLMIRFPANILANMFGFEKAPYFEADASAADAPDVGALLGE